MASNGWISPEQRAIRAAAYKVYNAAIRRGQLVRQPCERCGSTDAQGHHDDYSKPIDVRWLCSKHHHEVHRELGTPIGPVPRVGVTSSCTVRFRCTTAEKTEILAACKAQGRDLSDVVRELLLAWARSVR